ncbi:MAG: flagellar protein FlaG [Bacillota bacterium]
MKISGVTNAFGPRWVGQESANEVERGDVQAAARKSRAWEHLLDEMNRDLAAGNMQYDYGIHEASNKPVVFVKDAKTGEVLRIIPPEQLLKVFARILEYIGLILDERC